MPTPAVDVAHILRRTGFNSSAFRVSQLTSLDRPALVDALLTTTGSPADTGPSTLHQYGVSQWQQNQDLSTWWLTRMATTPTPIVEKMTLFWHGHFVSSFDKVGNAFLMYGQNRLFRANALGYLLPLAKAMAIQPAMLMYLDNNGNVKGSPNQNFARELMELFLMGVGNYTEDDVIASARAWTGHGIDPATGSYKFNPAQHDTDPKTFFGTTKNWDGPDIITEILTNPATRLISARFITRKLWTFFAYPNPADTIVNELADTFIASNLNVKSLLRALFLHSEFWSTTARQGLVRSPVEYVVTMLRQLNLAPVDAHPEWYLPSMGQTLLAPPDVSGWKANAYWISTSAASARAEFAQRIAWMLSNRGVFSSWDPTVTATIVNKALALVGITSPSANTTKVLTDYVNAQKAVATWPIPVGLCTLALLCPEMQLA